MADPLSFLREYNAHKKEIIVRDNLVYFGRYFWPKHVKTKYKMYQSKLKGYPEDYYTLYCLLYFLKNIKLSHAAYIRKAAAANIPWVRRPDRKGLLAYFYRKTSSSSPIDKSSQADRPKLMQKYKLKRNRFATKETRLKQMVILAGDTVSNTSSNSTYSKDYLREDNISEMDKSVLENFPSSELFDHVVVVANAAYRNVLKKLIRDQVVSKKHCLGTPNEEHTFVKCINEVQKKNDFRLHSGTIELPLSKEDVSLCNYSETYEDNIAQNNKVPSMVMEANLDSQENLSKITGVIYPKSVTRFEPTDLNGNDSTEGAVQFSDPAAESSFDQRTYSSASNGNSSQRISENTSGDNKKNISSKTPAENSNNALLEFAIDRLLTQARMQSTFVETLKEVNIERNEEKTFGEFESQRNKLLEIHLNKKNELLRNPKADLNLRNKFSVFARNYKAQCSNEVQTPNKKQFQSSWRSFWKWHVEDMMEHEWKTTLSKLETEFGICADNKKILQPAVVNSSTCALPFVNFNTANNNTCYKQASDMFGKGVNGLNDEDKSSGSASLDQDKPSINTEIYRVPNSDTVSVFQDGLKRSTSIEIKRVDRPNAKQMENINEGQQNNIITKEKSLSDSCLVPYIHNKEPFFDKFKADKITAISSGTASDELVESEDVLPIKRNVSCVNSSGVQEQDVSSIYKLNDYNSLFSDTSNVNSGLEIEFSPLKMSINCNSTFMGISNKELEEVHGLKKGITDSKWLFFDPAEKIAAKGIDPAEKIAAKGIDSLKKITDYKLLFSESVVADSEKSAVSVVSDRMSESEDSCVLEVPFKNLDSENLIVSVSSDYKLKGESSIFTDKFSGIFESADLRQSDEIKNVFPASQPNAELLLQTSADVNKPISINNQIDATVKKFFLGNQFGADEKFKAQEIKEHAILNKSVSDKDCDTNEMIQKNVQNNFHYSETFSNLNPLSNSERKYILLNWELHKVLKHLWESLQEFPCLKVGFDAIIHTFDLHLDIKENLRKALQVDDNKLLFLIAKDLLEFSSQHSTEIKYVVSISYCNLILSFAIDNEKSIL